MFWSFSVKCFSQNLDFEVMHYRSSHRRCSIKICVLENFAKFTGKHLCQSLFFNKVAGLRLATLFKKRLWHRCFLVNFAIFLRTPSLPNTSEQVLLTLPTNWRSSNCLQITYKKCFNEVYRNSEQFLILLRS